MKTKILPLILLLGVIWFGSLTAQDINVSPGISISVSVTGDVINPGIYMLTPLNHVSDALAYADRAAPAFANSQQSNAKETASQLYMPKPPVLQDTTRVIVYGHRTVILDRQGTKQSLDLLKFQRLGDMTQNPYLRDGDVIIVGPLQRTLTLQGEVTRPGDYEFRPGDTLKSLLDLALGILEQADLEHVMLYRYNADYSEFTKTELDISGYPNGSGSAMETALQAGDRIIIPTNAEFRKAYKVQVTGKVKMPGMYYVDDKTTLYDLMQMCGGPTTEADLGSSFIYNRLVSENYDPDFERLSKYAYGSMTWLEYSYLRTKTRQLKGKYSVNVSVCWNSQGKAANLFLRDGDALYVPELINGVWVAGQVKNPGLVNWHQDLKWKDYLQAAGGFANNRKAQGTRIIRVNSGNWIKPSNKVEIHAGDIIFVPDREERYTWDYIKEALLMTSQLLTVIIALRTF